MRGPPHVKLTVHVVELASQTVWSTLAILEDLSAETSEEVCAYIQLCASYICYRERFPMFPCAATGIKDFSAFSGYSCSD